MVHLKNDPPGKREIFTELGNHHFPGSKLNFGVVHHFLVAGLGGESHPGAFSLLCWKFHPAKKKREC